jgi:hypothetical protein
MKKLALLGLFIGALAFGAIGEVEKQDFANKNILPNSGFENGKAKWAASGGTFTTTTTAARVGYGGAAASFDASAGSQILSASALTIPPALYGRNGTFSCLIQTPTGTATHTLSVYDGSNTLASQTVVSSTAYTKVEVNFVFPSSGLITPRITSAADEPTIYVDGCYLGAASNISNVSQAQFIGSAYIPTVANCTWSRTSTSFGAFTADTDCGGPTVEFNPGPGTIQTTDADLPRFTVNNLPPGYYEVSIETSQGTTENINAALAISDGTTTSGATSYNTNAGSEFGHYVKGFFSYTSSGNRSFELYGRSASGTFNVVHTQQAGVAKMNFSIKRYPSASEVAYNPSQVPALWSGYHEDTCVFAFSTNSLADSADDGTCTLVETKNINFGTVVTYGASKPGITFTPKITGDFEVCASFSADNSATGETKFELSDTTPTTVNTVIKQADTNIQDYGPVCGIYSVSSLSSKTVRLRGATDSGTVSITSASYTAYNAKPVRWTIKQITPQVSNPQIVNSVTSESSGGVKIASAYITNSGTPTVSSQDGSFITSITDNGVGDFTLNYSSSTWSAAPRCFISPASGGGYWCNGQSVPTTTTARFQCWNVSGGGTAADFAVQVMCVGAK